MIKKISPSQMRPYLILDDNQDNIIPIECLDTVITSKMATTIKPLGDTQSLLNMTLKWNNYRYLRDSYNTSWKKSLSIVLINDDDTLTSVNYYGTFVTEVTTTAESDLVDIELRADYHEVNYDDSGEIRSLFKAWERELKLNQLGI
jgi:hypothetical protein